MTESGPSVTAHDDEVNLSVFSHFDCLVKRGAVADDKIPFNPGVFDSFKIPLHPLGELGFEGLQMLVR